MTKFRVDFTMAVQHFWTKGYLDVAAERWADEGDGWIRFFMGTQSVPLLAVKSDVVLAIQDRSQK